MSVHRFFLIPLVGPALISALISASLAQAPPGEKLASLKSQELSAEMAAKQDLADAQELETEAALVTSPDEASAALFAHQRAQQLRADAASADARAQQLRQQITSLEAPAAPTPTVAAAGATTPTNAAAPAAAGDSGFTSLVSVASCYGIDVQFASSTAPDGGELVKMHFLNHNAYATSVSFRPVFQGASGQHQPTAGDTTVRLDPTGTRDLTSPLVKFAIAEWGLGNMSVSELDKNGNVAVTQPCLVRPTSVH
ncbi:MAG TPA: hypothetical protein VIC32_01525 [Terriglobales bacterium]|jgi:hypothetical protein